MLSSMNTHIETIVVIGAGIMGRGIAHAAASGGFKTILNDVSDDVLQKALNLIRRDLQKGVEIGKLSGADMDAAILRLSSNADMIRAAKQADLVIEAVPERIDIHRNAFL